MGGEVGYQRWTSVDPWYLLPPITTFHPLLHGPSSSFVAWDGTRFPAKLGPRITIVSIHASSPRRGSGKTLFFSGWFHFHGPWRGLLWKNEAVIQLDRTIPPTARITRRVYRVVSEYWICEFIEYREKHLLKLAVLCFRPGFYQTLCIHPLPICHLLPRVTSVTWLVSSHGREIILQLEIGETSDARSRVLITLYRRNDPCSHVLRPFLPSTRNFCRYTFRSKI